MKLIGLTIHRNGAPIAENMPAPFRSPQTINAINIDIAVQFEDEGRAISFTSDLLKLIDEFRGLGIKE